MKIGFRRTLNDERDTGKQSLGLEWYLSLCQGKTVMVIGIAEIILYLPESHSLKDKRQVVKSIKDKVRNRFNVAIAEIDDLDLWQKARLGVCSLGNDRRQVNGRLDLVINFIERLQVATDIDTQIELLDY